MEQTYTAIETWGGFLAFTDTAEGRGKLRQFLQQTADAYFNPAFNSGALHVYRAEGKLGNRPWVNPGRMRPDEYPYGPKPHGSRMELLYSNQMRPTAEDFRSFCHNAGCEISARNVNITDTLDALERYDRQGSITIIVPINAVPLNNKHMITIHCDNLSDEFTAFPPQFQ